MYINKDNVRLLKKYGLIGLYLIIAEQELEYEEFESNIDKDIRLLNLVNKNIAVFKRKFSRYKCINISGDIIDETISNIIENLSIEQQILITGYFNNNDSIEKIFRNEKVYFYNVPLNRLNIEQIETYINLKKNNKVLKSVYDDQAHRDKLVIDNELEEFCFNISSIEDVHKLMNLCRSNREINKLNMNVNVSNYTLLNWIRAFMNFNDYLEVNINLNVDVKNIDIQRIPEIYNDNCIWHINAYGIEFKEYYEFYNFNNLIKLLNKKIPKEASDIEKTIFISNFIVNFLDYDEETFGNKTIDDNGNRVNTSMSDVIWFGSGVCRHYASLAKCLLNYYNIDCEYVRSDTKEYINALNNGETIEYDENGRKVNEDFIGHAFNIVYLEGKPYWLDLTWCEFKNYGIVNDSNFLVSTDTFSKEHSDFVEIDNYYCENDYDRKKIEKAIDNILFWNSKITIEDINWLSRNRMSIKTLKEDSLISKKGNEKAI